MAQKSEINKSQAIRDYLTQNPKTPAKLVVAALAEKGIKVVEGHVYVVKGKMRARKRRQGREKVARDAVTASGNGDALSTIKKIKSMAIEVGGMKKLKALVDVLSE